MSDKYNQNFEVLISKALSGDISARDEIVENNVGLVHSAVRRFSGRGAEAEDLFQIGCIGLIKAINNFDTSFNVKFSTYAVPMIFGEIKRFLRDDGIIKVSRSLKELSIKAVNVKELLTKENGSEPTVKEIASSIGVSPEEISFAIEASARPESIYATTDSGSGENKALIDKIESPVNFEAKVLNKIMLDEILNSYSARDRKIIIFRYFKQKTQSETARILGISQVQVSRIEKKLLTDMKRKLTK